MKTYTEHIFEELVDNSTEEKLRRYLERKRREREGFEMNRPHPKTREELQDMIVKAIEENGPEVDLNYIDVSGINDMELLFRCYRNDLNSKNNEILMSFNGDISEWDVRNVTNMNHMFWGAKNFNVDISEWDVSSVRNMGNMFCDAENFNQDISGWDVSRVWNMVGMFQHAESFNQDISGWDVSSVTNMEDMFKYAESFDQDLSEWKVDKAAYSFDTFKKCPILGSHKPHFNKDNFILQ